MKKYIIISGIVLSLLFFKSFIPRYTLFSNDSPVGQNLSEQAKIPGAFMSVWVDLNYLGYETPPIPISPSGGFRTICEYGPLTLLFLGVCALVVWKTKLTFNKLVGIICFIFVGICIFAIVGGLNYAFCQALVSVSMLVFLFAIIIAFS